MKVLGGMGSVNWVGACNCWNSLICYSSGRYCIDWQVDIYGKVASVSTAVMDIIEVNLHNENQKDKTPCQVRQAGLYKTYLPRNINRKWEFVKTFANSLKIQCSSW